jgi:hypothetical protein
VNDFDPTAVPPASDPLSDPAEAELLRRIAEAKALIEGLPIDKANVARFLERDAVAAAVLLKRHEWSYFWRLSRRLEPFSILRQWEAAMRIVTAEMAEDEQKVADKVRLITLADETLELWHDGSESWCWPKELGPACCWRMPSSEAKRYLLAKYGERHQITLDGERKAPMTPSRQAVSEAMDQLEAMAHSGPRRSAPALRVGGDGARLVLDLCRDDYNVVVVENGGWKVGKAPLAMRRSEGMLPLPLPVQGAGNALGDLRILLGFDGAEHDAFWALFVGFMFAALRPIPPYFVLGLAGEQGTGKTTTVRVLRTPVDPHEVDVQPKPRSEDDLFVNADGQWLLGYDNFSMLDQHWSDAHCRISTGTGYSKRKLYTDRETARFKVARPQIITSIVDVVAAPDLLDRTLLMDQPEIDGDPAPEEELLAAVAELAPSVLGQLLDAAAVAVREQRTVKLSRVPRMVGPTKWVEAAAEALGLAPGQFLEAYLDSQARAGELALESSLIGVALVDMLQGRDTLAKLAEMDGLRYGGPVGFEGTAKDLLKQLNDFIYGKPHPRRGWPKTPRGMGGALRRVAPALRKLGYGVEFARAAGTGERAISITTPNQHSAKTFYNAENRHDRHDRHTPASDRDGRDGCDGGMQASVTSPKLEFADRTVGMAHQSPRKSQKAAKSQTPAGNGHNRHDRHITCDQPGCEHPACMTGPVRLASSTVRRSSNW